MNQCPLKNLPIGSSGRLVLGERSFSWKILSPLRTKSDAVKDRARRTMLHNTALPMPHTLFCCRCLDS